VTLAVAGQWSCLVTADCPIDAEWLAIAGAVEIHVFRCPHRNGLNRFEPVVAAVASRLHGPGAHALTGLVTEAQHRLVPLANLVEAVLLHPWDVRHPNDLSRVTGIPTWRIRADCLGLGYRRVEHFLTDVRSLAVRVLVTHEGLPIRLARSQVGISDASNFRRQLARRSYDVTQDLNTGS